MTSAGPTPKLQDKPIVFVVDDDISVRESLEMLIQFAGWQPETFASAEEFLAHPRVLTPNCLVLDVSLPELNGLDLQKLVADRVEMPIILAAAGIVTTSGAGGGCAAAALKRRLLVRR